MPWRSRCLCIGYRAVPWCPLSSSKIPDTYAIHLHLHLHLHLLILLVILSSRHSPVYYYYTPSLPPLVPNRSTDIWTLPLADITAAVFLDKPILRPRHQPLNTSLDIYLRDKTINRHRLDNHHQQQLTQLNSTQLNSTQNTHFLRPFPFVAGFFFETPDGLAAAYAAACLRFLRVVGLRRSGGVVASPAATLDLEIRVVAAALATGLWLAGLGGAGWTEAPGLGN